jgi:hypothetical protein
MGRACSTHGQKMNAHTILMGKPEGKRLREEPTRKCGNNSEMDLSETRGGVWTGF